MYVDISMQDRGRDPSPVQVQALRWLPCKDLPALGIMVADQPLVDRLVREGIPPWRSVIGPNH